MIPKIKNIHQKVFDAVSKDHSKLDMNTWHTTCGTSHCRAGWVITIAGEEGRKLEELTDTCFAAMMIYKKSSNIKVPVVRFFEDQKIALEDIERCAKEEVNLINNTRPDY